MSLSWVRSRYRRISKGYNCILFQMQDLRSLLQPKEKSFDQLAKTLGEHLEPKPQNIVKRFHMHCRNQEQY